MKNEVQNVIQGKSTSMFHYLDPQNTVVHELHTNYLVHMPFGKVTIKGCKRLEFFF